MEWVYRVYRAYIGLIGFRVLLVALSYIALSRTVLLTKAMKAPFSYKAQPMRKVFNDPKKWMTDCGFSGSCIGMAFRFYKA